MKKVSYSEEDINLVLKALNSLVVRGEENARYVVFIGERLRSGKIEETDTENSSESTEEG